MKKIDMSHSSNGFNFTTFSRESENPGECNAPAFLVQKRELDGTLIAEAGCEELIEVCHYLYGIKPMPADPFLDFIS
jgi:hypothetical protein